MKINKMVRGCVPSLMKRMGRTIWRYFKQSRGRTRLYSREELHQYWKNPSDVTDDPRDYLKRAARSEFLVELMRPYVDSQDHILEIGCNAGRNLHFLWNAHFEHLSGIEINTDALALLKREFPDMASAIRLWNAPVEDIICDIPSGDVDVTFTMATLEHIHPDSEGLFEEMARVTKKYIFTVEDEGTVSARHVPRDYSKVFPRLGFELVKTIEGAAVQEAGLPRSFRARVFARRWEDAG